MPHPSAAPLDLFVLACYFLVILGVGVFFYTRNRSVDGFTTAGRSLPGWLTGLSILGTYVSSISFLAVPGKAFAADWNAFVFSLSLLIATPIAVRWFLPYYRKSTYVSAYQHLEDRFGVWARVYASACYLLTQLARMGTVMYLMALPMHVLLGWNLYLIIAITGIVVTAYTFMGGITAVIWTDAIQTLILIVGATCCLGYMIFRIPDAPGSLFIIATHHDKFSLGNMGLDLTKATFWVTLTYGLFINLNNFGIDQNYVQRYVASRSDAEARKSIWMGGLLYIPVSAVFFFIGTALFCFYSAFPDRLPAALTEKPDQVFPWFIVNELPAGVSGLLIAAVFAAAMSTISTSLNSSATIILNDYYQRFFKTTASEKDSMRFLLGTTLLLGFSGTLMALAMSSVKNVLDIWWVYAGIFSGGMLGLFLMSLLVRHIRPATAMIATVAGLMVILWMSISPGTHGWFQPFSSPFHSYMITVFGTSTILLVGLILTVFLAPQNTK